MSSAGDVSPGLVSEAGRCWRMVHDHDLQATNCDERPAWPGRWRSPKGDRWFLVWTSPDHLEGRPGSGSSAGVGPSRESPCRRYGTQWTTRETSHKTPVRVQLHGNTMGVVVPFNIDGP